MAMRLNHGIARVICTPVNHPLGHAVHFAPIHVDHASHRFQRLCRNGHGKIIDNINVALPCDAIQNVMGLAHKLGLPNITDSFWGNCGENRMAFALMIRTIFAHHILPHQLRHQSIRLIRGKDRNVFFTDENIVPLAHQNSVQFGNVGDGRIPPQDRKSWIRITNKSI